MVVDTVGFNGREWLDTAKGHPANRVLACHRAFYRQDIGHMQIDITIDDPAPTTKPWRANVPFHLLADTDLIETYCENEKDHVHEYSQEK